MKRFIYQNNKEELKYTGVYSIRINGNIYIGSTSSKRGFNTRFNNHKLDLLKNKHHSIYLQNCFNKYKDETLIFQILHICKPEECLKWEQFYINLLNPIFNSCKIAGSNKGYKKTKKQIINHKNAILKYYSNNKSHNIKLNKLQLINLIEDINLGLSKDIICEKYNIKKSTFYNIKKENHPFIKDLDIEINNLIGNLKNNGKSKYKGISFNKNCNKWQLEFNKKYIGLFTTEEEAIIKLKKLDSESRINK